MKRTTKWCINACLAFLVVSLVANLFVSYQSFETLITNSMWIPPDERVLLDLEGTISLLKDAETGQRGYLLTGDEAYLTPYRNALPRIEGYLGRVAKLTSDSANQRHRMAELRRLIAEKLTEMRQTIDLRREEGLQSSLDVVRSDRGRLTMAAIRQLMAEMEEEESRSLALRSAIQRLFGTLCILTLATLLLVVLTRTSRGPARAFAGQA